MAKKPKASKETGTNIADTIRAIQSKFGDESIMKLGDKPHVGIDAIPTGSLALDAALGIGGVPRGRVIEIFGPESSGKTTLALHIVAQAQKKGGICAFIDAEHALDPEYSKKRGVKTEELLISQPDYGEQALDIAESLIRSGKIDVVVIDSVAALTPKDEIEGDVGDYHVGKQARMMSQALRKMTSIVDKSKTVVIFINQIRMQIGVMFGNPETTPGGKALKFYSSVRMDVRRIAQIKKGEEVIGGRIRVKVVKNKIAAPFRQAEFDLLYNEGISPEGELLALGEKYSLIHKSGASYSYTPDNKASHEIKLGRGYDAARAYLREKPELKEELLAKLKPLLSGQPAEEGSEEEE
ncbi:MAG: recombinase RecA [Candidatus Paceibacterota bacterium]|jgi:recombination protein RecA